MSPAPRISICEVTTLHASLEEDLAAYAAAGAAGIGLCEVKLQGDDGVSADLVRASGLTVTYAVPEIASVLAGPMIPGPRTRASASMHSAGRSSGSPRSSPSPACA